MHGGTVKASSGGAGKGAEFVVRLPVVLETSQARPAAANDDAPEMARRRILIVDDNRDSAASLALLLDIGLPKLNGFEVCRHIRAEEWGRDMKIVAVSGWGQDDDRRKSREVGFDHHMVKPVSYAVLLRIISGEPASPRLSGSVG